ncbi:MAG: hypothetical protein WC269_05555 [Candidatus Gracilibacteria bacterium]|jgi:hypothetical protein
MADSVERIIVEDVGGGELGDGEFFVAVQISEGIRMELKEHGVGVLPDNPIDGTLQSDGNFLPDMTVISEFTDGDPTFCIESVDESVPANLVGKTLFEKKQEVRAKIHAVVDDQSIFVADVLLVVKKEDED